MTFSEARISLPSLGLFFDFDAHYAAEAFLELAGQF